MLRDLARWCLPWRCGLTLIPLTRGSRQLDHVLGSHIVMYNRWIPPGDVQETAGNMDTLSASIHLLSTSLTLGQDVSCCLAVSCLWTVKTIGPQTFQFRPFREIVNTCTTTNHSIDGSIALQCSIYKVIAWLFFFPPYMNRYLKFTKGLYSCMQ